MPHPELAAEQAYVDRAYEALDHMRTTVERTQEAMATEWAALNMEAWAKRRIQTFEDAERGLVFGRLAMAASVDGGAADARPEDPAAGGGGGDATPRPLYVGRRWVHGDEHESLVVNWQAPAARPFYTATPSEPQGVRQRRRYRTEGRRLLDISDEALDGSALEGVAVSDFLLEELERRRDVRMRDIVATIQSDQYRLITAEPDGALVVQGGPGTGKTAVGLHRASWLLYTHRERLRRVLVVGPNPTFMDYVSHVLPALGEEAVEQRAVTELVDGIEVAREEEPDVARLKGDPRLREVVARAVELAVVPAPEELVTLVDGSYVRVRERDVAALLEQALAAGDAVARARERFRMAVLRRFYERYGELFGPRALRSFDELERGLRRGGFLTRWLDRVLPLPQPEKLVARLLTSSATLAAASEGVLDADERKLLQRDRPRRVSELRWSDHDVALLDEARTLLHGPPRTYGHVILDEAQDLSPLQLLAVSRRSATGSLTILGDVAQATGPVVYRRWEELVPFLPDEAEITIEELRHAYRVPAEIMDFALPLLDRIAPEVEPPLAYRQGGDPPRLVRVAADELLPAAIREAVALEDLEGLLAVIVPRSLTVDDPFPFPILTPRQAKGLEFDHVVVVEPAAIAAGAGSVAGEAGDARPEDRAPAARWETPACGSSTSRSRAPRRRSSSSTPGRCRTASARASARGRAGCSRSGAPAARTTARRGRGRHAAAGRASSPATGGSTSRSPPSRPARSAGSGRARGRRSPPQRACRVGDELFIREDVNPAEVLTVGLEERVTAQPVLEQPVVPARAAPPRSRDRNRNRVPDDDDERGAREERLEEACLEQVRRRLLEQNGPREIPVARPLLPQRPRALLARERRLLRQVRLGREAEAPGSAVDLRRRVDGLEVLTLVGRDVRAREAADLRVRREQPGEQRRAAPVQAGEEDETVPLHRPIVRSASVVSMRTRTLGDGGPEVPVVGLGTNNFGRRLDYEQSLAVIDAALDAGATLIDTADIYGQGTSEEHIGRALEGRRDRALIATKFGMPMDERPEERRGSPDYIQWAVESSLRRLRTDVIDVYQLHEPDPLTPLEETLGTLNDLVAEGKVRWIGSSNFSGEADRSRGGGGARHRPPPVRLGAERVLARRAGGRGRRPARLRAPRDRLPPVLPARERPAHGQVPPRRDGDGGSSRRARDPG